MLQYISGRKHYKQRPFIRFIGQDCTTLLPIMENSFDLMISLYAENITRWCKRYLKVGGLVLTNDHYNDADESAHDPEFELIGVLSKKGNKYVIVESNLQEYFVPSRRVKNSQKYTKNAEYYVFRKMSNSVLHRFRRTKKRTGQNGLINNFNSAC